MTHHIIYALQGLGQVRYCGHTKQTSVERLKRHTCKNGSEDSYRTRWIRSVQQNGGTLEIIPIFEWEDDDPELWGVVEDIFIRALREDGFELVNTAPGGAGGCTPKGWTSPQKGVPKGPMPLETRQKLSASRKGRKFGPHTPETRAKIAAQNAARNKTPEMREISRQNGLANRGRTIVITDEARENRHRAAQLKAFPSGKFLPDDLIPTFFEWLEAAA